MLVLFHGGGCPDGFTAAWAVWKKHPDAKFIGLTHTDARIPDEVDNEDVVIVDYAFNRESMLEVQNRAKSVVLLDHHKSAIEELEGFECDGILDASRSGAGLAWDWFHDEPRPWLIDYVEYRDIGTLYDNDDAGIEHPLPHVEELLLAVDSYEQTFDNWSMLADENLGELDSLIREGKAIKRYRDSIVQRIADRAYQIKFGDEKILCANTPVFISEVGHKLAQQGEFALTWYHLPGKTKFSLRSAAGKTDVCRVAQRIPGGGGHKGAAGFSGPSLKIQNVIKELIEGNDDD